MMSLKNQNLRDQWTESRVKVEKEREMQMSIEIFKGRLLEIKIKKGIRWERQNCGTNRERISPDLTFRTCKIKWH
jgi:hypothetical protein